MPPKSNSKRMNVRLRSPAAVVLIAAVAIRAGVIWGVPGGFAEDIDGYAAVADNLVRHGVFGYGERATAFRPPLYPILLAGVRATGLSWIWGAGSLHLILGVATVALAISLARRLGLGGGAWLAGLLTACDPLLLFHSRLLMTETLSAALVTAAAWTAAEAERRDSAVAWLCAGVLLGWNALARPTFLAWIPVALVVIVLACPGTGTAGSPSGAGRGHWGWLAGGSLDRRAWRRAFLAALGAAAVLLPWGMRNAVIFGSPVFGTTHGGYTLYLANNPDYYAYLLAPGRRGVWDAAEFNRRWEGELRAAGVEGEPAADRLAYALAWRTIAAQPGTFFRACWGRLASFWGVLPNAGDGDGAPFRRWARYAVAGFYALEMLAAVGGLWAILRGRRARLPNVDAGERTPCPACRPSQKIALGWMVSAIVVLTLVHVFYWTNLRMRAPVMPGVAVLAAAGIAAAWRRWSRKGRRVSPR